MTTAASGIPAEQRAWPGMDVAGLRILVTGFGVSGYAVADQTMQRGARVLVVDGADTPENREKAQILEVREEARRRKGWIMDTYLLRRLP